jgi:hypothetical protein
MCIFKENIFFLGKFHSKYLKPSMYLKKGKKNTKAASAWPHTRMHTRMHILINFAIDVTDDDF